MMMMLVTCLLQVAAQTYKPVDNGSSVNFSIKNFGLTVNGSFSGLEGVIQFDPAKPTSASFNVTVAAASINTGNNSRDKHLKKEEYFNTAAYPVIRLVSTRILALNGGGQYTMEGTVTIKGISKAVSFPFVVSGAAGAYVFSGSFTINRRDFKVGGSSLVLADKLSVNLKVKSVP